QGWVDLLPYTGTHKSRSKWWDDVYAKSHHSPSRRIILATHTAMSSDSEVAFRLADKKMRDARKHGDVREKGRYRASTLYGHKFGVFALDESHVVRTLNTIYTAARQLRIQSETMVALTATPVMTKATDLWFIGCMLGIPAFDEPQHDKELYQWRSQLATAMRNDRASAKHSGSAMKVVSRVAHGLSVEDDALENGFSKVVDAMMVDVRAKYDGFVVRRTLGSLDWEGKAISGLPPYAEHILMLKLTGEEYKNLDTIANEAAELNPGGSIAYNSGKVSRILL
ncbi:predicted protein, partial [Postia placenta Mad-698-R]